MQGELTGICYSHKHHAASTHADAQSVSEWQSLSQPGQTEETEVKVLKAEPHRPDSELREASGVR